MPTAPSQRVPRSSESDLDDITLEVAEFMRECQDLIADGKGLDEQQQARIIYSHQKCVCVVRSVCESSAKASNGWDTSETERTGITSVRD